MLLLSSRFRLSLTTTSLYCDLFRGMHPGMLLTFPPAKACNIYRHPRRADIFTKSDPDRQVMSHLYFLSGPRLSRSFNSGILQGQDERWYDKISQIKQRSAQIESKIDSLRRDHTALSKKFVS